MIKKFLLAVMLAVPMLVSAQTLKIGLVDSNAILAAMPETAQAQTKLDETSKKYEAEMTKLEEEINRLIEEYKKAESSNEPKAILERKARDIADQQQKGETFRQSAMQDLQRQQNELMAPIIQKIRNAIESVGVEGGYSLIQDNNPQMGLTLYHAAPVVEITNDVKAKLGIK